MRGNLAPSASCSASGGKKSLNLELDEIFLLTWLKMLRYVDNDSVLTVLVFLLL